jgi:Tfp pilus assembly protein PilN
LETIKINLATFKYQDKRISYPLMLFAAIIVLIISSLSIRTGINAQSEIKEYEKKTVEREQDVLKRQEIKKDKSAGLKDSEIVSLKKDIDFINGLINMDAFPYDRLLDSLELCVPSGIVILSFEMSKDFNKVTFEGRADSMNDITVFLNNLNKSRIYKNNNLLNLSVSQENNTQEESIPAGNGITFELESLIAMDQLWVENQVHSSRFRVEIS